MFIEVTENIKHLLDDPDDRVFRNDHTLKGASENAQFLRYKASLGMWELEARIGFTKLKVPLQEHQAKAIIESELGHVLTLAVTNHERPEIFTA